MVGKGELEGSGFTSAHLDGVRMHGWRLMSSIPVLLGELLRAGEPLVYAYYDGIDRAAHERGFGPFYDAELVLVDRLVDDIVAAMPTGAVLLVTADHGQVHVGANTRAPGAAVLARTRSQSGEGRFRWLHARAGAASELFDAAVDAHHDVAWVVSREQVIDEGWFGPSVPTPIAGRLGDVALVARDAVSFDDPADSGPYPLVCRHGSLTSAEMLVPLLAIRRA
jgi:hypothetical protein